jgi:enolase-phosphatase E1
MREARAILLDIEGTTTPVDFVYQTLFPYARQRLKQFITEHQDDADVRSDITSLREQRDADVRNNLAPPVWRDDSVEAEIESAATYVHSLMDQDRKAPALKSLQGKIWEAGYRAGELRGEIYADVPPAFARWRAQERSISIFSSGSVLAQKLIFGHSTAGDLTGFIRAYFDTTTGAKQQTESYQRIAAALEWPSPEILFLSDALAELDAAQLAGMQTALCARPGSKPPLSSAHRVIQTFAEVFP